MKAARLLIPVLLMAWGAPEARAGLRGTVLLFPIDPDLVYLSFTSDGEAAYYNALNQIDFEATLSGQHTVSGPQEFAHAVTGMGQYHYQLEGPAEWGRCYSTRLHVTGDPPGLGFDDQTWSGEAVRCAPPEPGGGSGCGYTSTCDTSQYCPLILDLNADGIHTTGLNDPISTFWIDLLGRPATTAWTNPDTEEAFLWIDLDHDRSAEVTELFGSRMVSPGGNYYVNGFVALIDYDRRSNGGDWDGQITRRDAIWPRLRLWVDRNHDAISQPAEISVPASHGIIALNLSHAGADLYDYNGNELYLTGTFARRIRGRIEYQMMADVEFTAR